MATEDEEQMNGVGGDALAAATAGTPAGMNNGPAIAPAPAQPNAAPSAMDTSALDAATQNLAPGQSVQDAGMGAVEASVNAAAQETRDRMRAGRDGIESPPSQWAQDVNNLFTGLTSAARRAAERLSQPQAQPAVQQPQEPRIITIGRNGRAEVGSKQQPTAFGESFTAASILSSGGSDAQMRIEQQADSFFQ